MPRPRSLSPNPIFSNGRKAASGVPNARTKERVAAARHRSPSWRHGDARSDDATSAPSPSSAVPRARPTHTAAARGQHNTVWLKGVLSAALLSNSDT
ncbi:hypothetical protein HPB50_005889 [Hyalomma asiaticum]|uniref:Uncharacterized protein n=1 Tax=Hyalomma asiaticum TaxID=266040 RepID=A0ACB7S6V0_HYAAI|nr:hypothetical protein HPB50_005889 [Hyalomma asiaticum]